MSPVRDRSHNPIGPATVVDIVRAVFHAIVALLFTVPMWILLLRYYSYHPEYFRQFFWHIGVSSLIIWSFPAVAVLYRWRQGIYDHPERATSSLVRTYARAQMVGVLLAAPVLLSFGSKLFRLFF